MASIRKIDFGEKDDPIVIEWNTGKLNELVYDTTKIDEVFETYIKPKLFNFRYSDRKEIKNTLRDLLRTGKFDDANNFINLLVALRTTILGDGYEIISRAHLTDDLEKIMYWNMAWHLNHNPKQFDKYIYIQAYDYNDNKKFISIMTADYQEKDVRYDTIYERDKKANKETNKLIKAKKKEQSKVVFK